MIFGGKRRFYPAFFHIHYAYKHQTRKNRFILYCGRRFQALQRRKNLVRRIDRAFKTYREIFIPAGRYYVDRSLIVPSDTKIYADEHAEIVLTKGTGTLLLRNESVIDGSDYKIPENAPCDENISV